MGSLLLGGEILATCMAWSLAGWLLGKTLDTTWPLVVFSLAGIVHALYGIVRAGSRKK